MKKHRQRAAAWFIFPLSLQFQEFMNGKCQGIGFPKPILWLLSSWRCDGAEGHRRDRTPAGPPHTNQEASSLLQGWTPWNQDFDNKDCVDLRWSTFKDDVTCLSGVTTSNMLTLKCTDNINRIFKYSGKDNALPSTVAFGVVLWR